MKTMEKYYVIFLSFVYISFEACSCFRYRSEKNYRTYMKYRTFEWMRIILQRKLFGKVRVP